MTVIAEEFIRRFLQHVLPAGVHKVRYYGLWSPSNRKKLLELQQTLPQSENDEQERFEEDMDAQVSAPRGPRPCPHCKKGALVWVGRLFRQGRGPAVRELTLISLTIKSHPKHDSSRYMIIPFFLSGEKKPRLNRRLRLVSHRSFPIDQPFTPCARSKPTNSSTVHR
jgi:hypothetical protein